MRNQMDYLSRRILEADSLRNHSRHSIEIQRHPHLVSAILLWSEIINAYDFFPRFSILIGRNHRSHRVDRLHYNLFASGDVVRGIRHVLLIIEIAFRPERFVVR